MSSKAYIRIDKWPILLILFQVLMTPQLIHKQSAFSPSERSPESTGESFEGIQLSVNEIRDQNLQISAAAEEQHGMAEDINRQIQQIYGVTMSITSHHDQ